MAIKLKNAPDIVIDSIYKGSELNGTMYSSNSSQSNLENIKKYDLSLELLEEIKESLQRGDEVTAQSKLRRLTGKLSPAGLVVFFLGIALIIFILALLIMRSNEPTIKEPQDEMERIRMQFKK
jgi:hypothetical protein